MVLALNMTWTHCEFCWNLDFEPSETSGGQPVALEASVFDLMLDSGLSVLVAALELYLREGNSVEELFSEVQCANCNRRQLSIVKELIDMWAPFVNFADIFEAVSRSAKSCHARLLSVKNVVITAMVRVRNSHLQLHLALKT